MSLRILALTPISALKFFRCFVISIVLPALATAQTASSPTTSERNAQTLQPGVPVEKRLAGGESYYYDLTISAGQYLRAVVEQRGIDVVVTLFAPDGVKLLEVDSPNGDEGPEPISWIAEIPGSYRIEVRSGDKEARPGRYEARIEALRIATEADRNRVGAEHAVADAEHLFDGDADSKRRALQKYEEALRLWRQLDDQPGVANAFTAIGDLLVATDERQKALESYSQALPIWRALRDPGHEATTLNQIGSVYSALGDKKRALDYYQLALPLRQAARDKTGEAITLGNIGQAYSDLGESRKALDFYNRALSLHRDEKDQVGQALALHNIGQAHRQLGEQRKALGYFNQALTIRRAINDRDGQASTLSSIGVIYSDLGEMQKALDIYNQSLPLRRDPRGRGNTLNNIGRAYDILGAPQEAINYYNQSLPLARSVADKGREGETLNYIGLAYWQSGDLQKALESFNQALELRRETQNRAGEATTLNNLGLVYYSSGAIRKALEAYNQALPIWRETGNRNGETYTLNNLGFAYESLGDQLKALRFHDQALKLSRAIGDRQREAKIRYGIARIQSARNELNQARAQIEQTIKIVESLRVKLASQELRASYRASSQRYYELYIDVLMRLGKRAPRSNLIAEALQVSERARARSLIELLTESGADIRQGVDTQLVERERELQEQINDKTTEQIRLLLGKNTAGRISALTEEIERAAAELRDTQARIRQSSPHYAALTQPQPLSIKEIQQNILDANTILLEYSLGAERSYLWALTRNALFSYTLPKRGEIESMARRYYELITAPGRALQDESKRKQDAAIVKAEAQSRQVAASLSRMLLAPAASLLGDKRLLIVADGALQYTPFAALPIPATGGRGEAKTRGQGDKETRRQGNFAIRNPLIVRHEIVNLPSASTLDVLRREMADKPKATGTVAVIADPVFESTDVRVKTVEIKSDKAGEKKIAPPPTPTSRILLIKSAKDSGASGAMFSIPRLSNTRLEADAILSLDSSKSGGGGKSAFDFAANRAAATSNDLGQYRIVHLATHGFLNSFNPELSGLALSLVDEKGAPTNGFLLAPEIYNLKLPATDLVVLSACQTGLGKEVRGEGMIGLTRGFMYAGAPRVVVSLWNVSDRATATLMKNFYQEMLTRGLRPAAALRAAQIEMLKLRDWRAPYYWAAFGLQGEWR